MTSCLAAFEVDVIITTETCVQTQSRDRKIEQISTAAWQSEGEGGSESMTMLIQEPKDQRLNPECPQKVMGVINKSSRLLLLSLSFQDVTRQKR